MDTLDDQIRAMQEMNDRLNNIGRAIFQDINEICSTMPVGMRIVFLKQLGTNLLRNAATLEEQTKTPEAAQAPKLKLVSK